MADLAQFADNIVGGATTAVLLAGGWYGFRKARAETATIERQADEAEAERLRREHAEERSATAALISNLTAGYENLINTLRALISDREQELRQLGMDREHERATVRRLENDIRKLRTQLHEANGELFKAGLQKLIVHPAEVVDPAIAPERREHPPTADVLDRAEPMEDQT